MDTQTIDQEFDKLQAQFQDVAATVESLATKLQAAHKAGDANATEWLADLEHVAHDIDGEQAQVKSLLLAIHAFINGLAQAHAQDSAAASAEPVSAGASGQELFAPGQDPFSQGQAQQQPVQQAPHRGLLGSMFGGMAGGGMIGGGMMGGGYFGSGFGQAMEMGMGMSLGADLINCIFR